MKSIDNVVQDSLRGQPFIEKIQKYEDPNDQAHGDSIPRECSSCFYRKFKGNTDGDCYIKGDVAKIDFGIKPGEFLPLQLDGKEVGNYCTHFVNHKSE